MGGRSKCDRNQIVIDNEFYYNKTQYSDIFGFFVDGYYVKDKNAEKILRSLYIHELKNTIIKFNAGDIV